MKIFEIRADGVRNILNSESSQPHSTRGAALRAQALPCPGPPDSCDSSSCFNHHGETHNRVSLTGRPLVRQVDLARHLEVRNFAYRALLSFVFNLLGQRSARLQECLVNSNRSSNSPNNNSLPLIPCSAALVQILAQHRRQASVRRRASGLRSHASIDSPSFRQVEHLVRHLQTRRACLVLQSQPPVSVPLECLAQLGLGPQLVLTRQVHLVSRAQAPQEPLAATVINLCSEQVSRPIDHPKLYFNITLAGQFDSTANVTTGTSNPPYTAFNEKDSTNTNLTLAYQSITCMEAYRGSSFEVSLIFC